MKKSYDNFLKNMQVGGCLPLLLIVIIIIIIIIFFFFMCLLTIHLPTYLPPYIQTYLQTLSDGLDLDLPHLPEEEKAEEAGTLGLSVWDGDMGQGANLGPYDDEETRAFYEDLPDLLAMVPSVGR